MLKQGQPVAENDSGGKCQFNESSYSHHSTELVQPDATLCNIVQHIETQHNTTL